MSQLSPTLRAALALVACITAAGCAGGGQPTWTAMPAGAEPTPAAASPIVASPGASAEASGPPSGETPAGESPGGEVVELTIGTDTGAALQFDPATATATADAGATLQLTFENRSATVPHNLTFADPINEATATTVAPGASEVLEFAAPEPGDYLYVCTLHPGMEGTLTVEGS